MVLATSAVRSCTLHLLLLLAWPVHGEPRSRCSSAGGCRKAAPARRAALSNELLENFIVIPEHRLLFCYVEKVACANFNELFRRLRGRYDPEQLEGPQWYKNAPQVHGITKTQLEDILANDTWHKAVFWRDPVERFVSAFLSKCGHADSDGYAHCASQFGVGDLTIKEAIASVANDAFGQQAGGLSDDSTYNKHWKRIGRFCGGLRETLHFYDTIEELHIQTANSKVTNLLGKVGVDPSSIQGMDALFPQPVQLKAHESPKVLWQTMFNDSFQAVHNTAAVDQLDVLLPPKQFWLTEALARHYAPDYSLFGAKKSLHFSEVFHVARSPFQKQEQQQQEQELQEQEKREKEEEQHKEPRRPIGWPLLDFQVQPVQPVR